MASEPAQSNRSQAFRPKNRYSASAVLGQTFVRVSGRIGNLNRANDSQLDEFMGRYRSDRIGPMLSSVPNPKQIETI